MSHSHDDRPAAVPADGGDPPLYVITLASSTAPLALKSPAGGAFTGLALFRSRRVEEGRERFRLHLGYFATAEAAEQLLPSVRESYPAAMVSVAPQSNLGSLDDTGLARFSILRPATGTPAARAPAPAAVPAPPAAAAPPAVPAAPAAPAALPLTLLADPLPGAAAAPPARADEVPVLHLADAVTRPAPPPAAPASAAPAPVPEVQHYAVQLVWSRAPIDLAKVPVLAIFGGYLLYAVETEAVPQRCYGVRLGFYADALSARLVAQYVRSEFRGVSVVPVSTREMERASGAAIRLGAARSPATRWPRAPLPVDMKNLGRAFTPGLG